MIGAATSTPRGRKKWEMVDEKVTVLVFVPNLVGGSIMRLNTARSGLCGASGTSCTFGSELYGGGKCSFGVAEWRLHNGRCFGTGLGLLFAGHFYWGVRVW